MRLSRQTQPSNKVGAIGAQYNADILSVMIEDKNKSVAMGSLMQQYSTKSAMISLGELLKRAAAVYHDVIPTNLQLQRLIVAGTTARTYRLFMSDSLESGSGLTKLSSSGKTFINILNDFYNHHNWNDPVHSNSCMISCANCLRTYRNMQNHSL